MLHFESALRHIELLTGSPDTPVHIRLIHDKPKGKGARKLYGSLSKLWPEIVAAQAEGFGVFVVANEGGNSDAEITRIRSVFIDADGLPLDQAKFHTQPDFIVRRDADHWHAYWSLTDCSVDDFEGMQKRLAAHYGTDKAVSNPSRVMRLAGTLHQKGDPILVTLEDRTNGAESWEFGRDLATLERGLQSVETHASSRSSKTTALGAVSYETLRAVLSWLDPNAKREVWIRYIAAIRATPLSDDDDESKRRELAHLFSRGALDRRGRYLSDEPERYEGPEAVDRAFDTLPPKDGGVTFRSLLKAANAEGFRGKVDWSDLQETFGAYLESALYDKPIPFSDILNRQVEPVREIIPGLLERDTVTFLSAPGGAHKSRLALQWGLCVNTAASIFGRAVERARFVYLSAEDNVSEVTRRAQAISRKLKLPLDSDALFWDRTAKDSALAVASEGGAVDLTPYFDALVGELKAISGHKLVVLDSAYNFVRFQGKAKIDEGAVNAYIRQVLERLCRDMDSTLLVLWHPSQAGQERGDASGWSVAWHNTPRARLSLKPVKDVEGAFELCVEKRNHGPKGKPLTLHFSEGVLLPLSQTSTLEQEGRLKQACIRVAVTAAEHSVPIQKQRRLEKWMLDEIEGAAGRRPTDREVKEVLAAAVRSGELRYLRGTNRQTAGYHPTEQRSESEAS